MSGLTSKGLRVPKTIKLFIGGEFPRTESGRSFPVTEAGSEKPFAHLCRGSRKDVRNCVTAAQAALPSWEHRSAYNRGQILYRMAEMTEGKREEFKETLLALGSNEAESDRQIDDAIDAFVYYAGFSDKFQSLIGTVNPVSGPHHNFTTPEPVGVVALILDEKASLGEIVASLSAILVGGNTVVALIPGSLGALLAPLAEVFATSDLPKGVVNLLSGHTDELATQFGMHMEIQSLSFQSADSVLLGKLRELGAENMKRVVPRVKAPLSLEHILAFNELKTVWHPVGY